MTDRRFLAQLALREQQARRQRAHLPHRRRPRRDRVRSVTRTITLCIVALALAGAIVLAFAGRGQAAPLPDPAPYLERHGLRIAVPVPATESVLPGGRSLHGSGRYVAPYWTLIGGQFYHPDEVEAVGWPLGPLGTCQDGIDPLPDDPCRNGAWVAAGIYVLPGLSPLDRAYVHLHETGHAISIPHIWPDGVPVSPTTLKRYEEGLVEAWTLHHLPGWWRYLARKPMRPKTILIRRALPGYDEADAWLVAADKATPGGRWSRAAREQLNAWLCTSLEQREAILNS
jgi:hypothetical protein